MIRRTFSCYCPVRTRLKLYISLIRSQLLYGSQQWRPMLVKDIQRLEQSQRRATKFILKDASSNYRCRLLTLGLLPLMMVYEFNDIMFIIKSVNSPTKSFNILNVVTFSSSSTRSSLGKFFHKRPPTNSQWHFYFQQSARLWNALPVLDLSLSTATLRAKIKDFLWSVLTITCLFHLLCPCSKCTAIPKPSNYCTL